MRDTLVQLREKKSPCQTVGEKVCAACTVCERFMVHGERLVSSVKTSEKSDGKSFTELSVKIAHLHVCLQGPQPLTPALS